MLFTVLVRRFFFFFFYTLPADERYNANAGTAVFSETRTLF